MAITIILELTAKPGRTRKVVEIMANALPETRAYDGCIDVTIHINEEMAEEILLIEHWETTAKYKAYFQWRVDSGFPAQIDPFLAGPPKLRYFQEQAD